MVRLSTPEGLARHGFTFQAIKEWRQKEYGEGRPSGFDDFLRQHGLCVECRGEGTLVLGVRWRDAEGVEHADRGPVASLVAKYNLDNPPKWLTDSLKWNYLYETCPTCGGTGKSKFSADVFSTVVLGNVDECRTECEISDDDGVTVAVVFESYDGWHVQTLRSVGEEKRDAFDATVSSAKETLSHYINRLGTNPPEGITAAALSLWLMERDDGTVLGMNLSDLAI